MNDKIDRVPELRLFSNVPLPEPGSYKTTKLGYKVKGEHVIIRRVEWRGIEDTYVRWKVQKGNAPPQFHPDWNGYRVDTNYQPSDRGPHKLQNRKKESGAMYFKTKPKSKPVDEVTLHEAFQGYETKENEKWLDMYDPEDEEQETQSEIDAREEAEQSQRWRSYAPSSDMGDVQLSYR